MASSQAKNGKYSQEDRQSFLGSVNSYCNGEKTIDSVLNSLGQQRRGDTAMLARDELKRILEKREEIEDVLGLEQGTLWTIEEEKLFEYGLYVHDGSTPDRFGQIAILMCGSRTREECKKRYMKLVLDICQIEMGSKSLSVVYLVPFNPGMAPQQVSASGQWIG